MEHDVIGRLRAARPSTAIVDETAFDADLLDRLRRRPIAGRRTLPRAVAVTAVAGATLTASAVILLWGGPGDVGGLSSASAIAQALHWLNPPPGSVLHVRTVETRNGHRATHELWRSAGDQTALRERVEGARPYEIAGDGLYDPSTDTIYKSFRPVAQPPHESVPAGDPAVTKVRILLQEGRMSVTGRERRNGTDAWAISLRPDQGRPSWTLWVSAATGKPLELRDPSDGNQTIRWRTYDVVRGSNAHDQLTLAGAHPSAHVVQDPDQVAAAENRLTPADSPAQKSRDR